MSKKKQHQWQRHAHIDTGDRHSITVGEQQGAPIALGLWQSLIRRINSFSEAHPLAYGLIIMTVFILIAVAFGMIFIKLNHTMERVDDHALEIKDVQPPEQELPLALPGLITQALATELPLMQEETTALQVQRNAFQFGSCSKLDSKVNDEILEISREIIQDESSTSSKQRLKDIKKIAEKICADINANMFVAYNNPLFKIYINGTLKNIDNYSSRESVGKIMDDIRSIYENATNVFLKKYKSKMDKYLDENIFDDPSGYVLYIDKYFNYIKDLIEANVVSTVFTITNGGRCGEFSYYAAIQTLRAFNNWKKSPSISIVELSNPEEPRENHAVLSIRDKKINENEHPFFDGARAWICDSWLHQENTFFSSRKASSKPTYIKYKWETVHHIIELGVVPDMIGVPDNIQEYFKNLRQELISKDLKLARADKTKLKNMKDLLDEEIIGNDAHCQLESRLRR